MRFGRVLMSLKKNLDQQILQSFLFTGLEPLDIRKIVPHRSFSEANPQRRYVTGFSQLIGKRAHTTSRPCVCVRDHSIVSSSNSCDPKPAWAPALIVKPLLETENSRFL